MSEGKTFIDYIVNLRQHIGTVSSSTRLHEIWILPVTNKQGDCYAYGCNHHSIASGNI